MQRALPLYVGLVALFLVSTDFAFAAVPKSTAYGTINWTAVIARHRADANFTGSVLVIGDRTGNLLVQEEGDTTYGTIFQIASSTKWLTSAVAHTFVADGIMTWDDKPQKFISWWTNSSSDPRSNITLKDLLSFTSGFVGEMERNPNNASQTDCVNAGSRIPNIPFEDCVREIYDTCFVYNKSGTTFDYGSTHMSIFALMAMKADRVANYNAVGQPRVSGPLGANMSFARNPAGGVRTTTMDYEIVLREIYLQNPRYYNPISDLDYTPTATVTLAYTPAFSPSTLWHYTLGHWYECDSLNFTQACIDQKVFSSAGANGFYPMIDRVNDYYMILGRFGSTGRPGAISSFTGNDLQPLIAAALTQARAAASPMSSTPTATTSTPTATTSTPTATTSTRPPSSSAPTGATPSSAASTTLPSSSSVQPSSMSSSSVSPLPSMGSSPSSGPDPVATSASLTSLSVALGLATLASFHM